MAAAIEKRDVNLVKKELSNNILALVLIVIIFVSLMGTFIVYNAISAYKEGLSMTTATKQTDVAGGTNIGFSILPSSQQPTDKNKNTAPQNGEKQ